MIQKPTRSLRSILSIWFLFFSVVPLAFFTFYSAFKTRSAVEYELQLRLKGNIREFSEVIAEYRQIFASEIASKSEDQDLRAALLRRDIVQLKRVVTPWLDEFRGSKISVIRPDGTFYFSLRANAEGGVEFERELRRASYQLSPDSLQKLDASGQSRNLLVKTQGDLHLITNRQILDVNGRSLGYLEFVFSVTGEFLANLRQRFGAEVFVLDRERKMVSASSQNLLREAGLSFLSEEEEGSRWQRELTLDEVPYYLVFEKVDWGGEVFYLGLGASREFSENALSSLNLAFMTVNGGILLLLIVTILMITKSLLRPVNQLVDASRRIHEADEAVEVPVTNRTEIGVLARSFNEMAHKVIQTSTEHKKKIRELEKINAELQQTQTQLVQSAKLASLGELVAGVAHELNNPISFIYSNMEHLREYVEVLNKVVAQAEKDPRRLAALKKEVDFDYIQEDLPKLIQSCEEGAQRTRDIVVGLKTFSRMDEGKLITVDLHQSIEASLRILSSEFKGRIVIEKSYGEIPEVVCYPGRLSQVFVNILQNAGDAIKERGKIRISTRPFEKDWNSVCIEISDDGEGMDSATQSKIFEPFFTTKPVGDGTGLGMSISYGIIDSHQGQITVESTVGEGSTFRIVLPIDGPTKS